MRRFDVLIAGAISPRPPLFTLRSRDASEAGSVRRSRARCSPELGTARPGSGNFASAAADHWPTVANLLRDDQIEHPCGLAADRIGAKPHSGSLVARLWSTLLFTTAGCCSTSRRTAPQIAIRSTSSSDTPSYLLSEAPKPSMAVTKAGRLYSRRSSTRRHLSVSSRLTAVNPLPR